MLALAPTLLARECRRNKGEIVKKGNLHTHLLQILLIFGLEVLCALLRGAIWVHEPPANLLLHNLAEGRAFGDVEEELRGQGKGTRGDKAVRTENLKRRCDRDCKEIETT